MNVKTIFVILAILALVACVPETPPQAQPEPAQIAEQASEPSANNQSVPVGDGSVQGPIPPNAPPVPR